MSSKLCRRLQPIVKLELLFSYTLKFNHTSAMMKEKTAEIKRVFFAFEVVSPWPKDLPEGRILAPENRHLTVVFIGNVNFPSLEKILPHVPLPDLKVGLAGKFDKELFLPPKRPNVVAWHVNWFDEEHDLGAYQKELARWLIENNYNVRLNPKGFLPHVTLARRPFKYNEWRQAFSKLPVFITNLHLYESTGGLNYVPLWTHGLIPPYKKENDGEESLFVVNGESPTQLFHHCLTAIAFEYPLVLRPYTEKITVENCSELDSPINYILEKAQRKNYLPSCQVKTVRKPEQDSQGVYSWKFSLARISHII